MRFKLITILSLCCLACNTCPGQERKPDKPDVDAQIMAFIKKHEQKAFRIGMSIGLRTGIPSEKSSRAVAYVTPDKNVIAVDYRDLMALIVSTSLTTFPWERPKWLGFTANINLAELSDKDFGTVFNKQIDGGIGLAFAMGKTRKFALGLTYERTAVRRPTQYVLDREGQQITESGQVITSLDPSDPRLFIDSGLNAVSAKFIYLFN